MSSRPKKCNLNFPILGNGAMTEQSFQIQTWVTTSARLANASTAEQSRHHSGVVTASGTTSATRAASITGSTGPTGHW